MSTSTLPVYKRFKSYATITEQVEAGRLPNRKSQRKKSRRIIDSQDVINSAFHTAYNDTSRFLFLFGGAGSGKSYFAGEKVLIRTMSKDRHCIVCTRKVGTTLRDSVFSLLKYIIGEWGVSEHFEINKTEMSFTYIPNGNRILLKGLDEVDKIKSIHGITSFWHEEATELVPYDLIQMNLRLRGKMDSYPQHILTFNPIARSHWVRKIYFKELKPAQGEYLSADRTIMVHGKKRKVTVTIMRSTYLDNLDHLDEEYETELMALREEDPVLYMVYALGEWGVLKNVIYKPYDLTPWPNGMLIEETFYGLDFGYRHPMALLKFDMHEGDPYETEIIYATQHTIPQLLVKMANMQVRSISAGPPYHPIIADNANPGAIEEINKGGFLCLPCDKGPGSVYDGIVFVKSLKLHGKNSNENCIAERDGYVWKTNKDGEVVHPERPSEISDHAMDAERYALYTILRPRIKGGESHENQQWDDKDIAVMDDLLGLSSFDDGFSLGGGGLDLY